MQGKTIWAWTSISMWALLAHFSAGSWPALVVLGAVCYGVMKLLPENTEQFYYNKWYCAAQLVGILLLLIQLMPMSAQYWPGKYAHRVVPGVLVVMAGFGCRKKPERVAGILFWGMILLMLPALIAAGRDVRLEWLLPEDFNFSVWTIPVLLLPHLSQSLTKEEGTKWYFRTVLVGVVLWMITAGILSPKAAWEMETPFRNVSMSLTLGAYSRFESLIAVALTFGWYGFASLMLACAGKCLEGLKIKRTVGLWICVIFLLTIGFLNVKIPPEITVIYLVLTWIFFPIFELKKISKKSEKSA